MSISKQEGGLEKSDGKSLIHQANKSAQADHTEVGTHNTKSIVNWEADHTPSTATIPTVMAGTVVSWELETWRSARISIPEETSLKLSSFPTNHTTSNRPVDSQATTGMSITLLTRRPLFLAEEKVFWMEDKLPTSSTTAPKLSKLDFTTKLCI